MPPEPRERRSPGANPGPDKIGLAADDTDMIAGQVDSLVADRWAAWSVRQHSAKSICHYCEAHPRHPDSPLCIGCLEIGAGDVWQQGGAA